METIEREGERVRQNIPLSENAKIDAQILNNIKYFATQDQQTINARIYELDREWDMERTLELNSACFALAGVILAYMVHALWLLLPVVIAVFLIQHALQGWCPPFPLLRKWGIRTRPEIDREKYALKALKGDFKNLRGSTDIWQAVSE